MEVRKPISAETDYLASGGTYQRVQPKGNTPSSAFIVYDRDAFGRVLGAEPAINTLIATDAHEGPVYVKSEDALYFTTVVGPSNTPWFGGGGLSNKVQRYALSGNPKNEVQTVIDPSNMANGMTLSHDGKSLLICEQGTVAEHSRISAYDLAEGRLATVVDHYFGLRFTSPNDIVVKRSDGTIWFTDPSYGVHQGFRAKQLLGDYLYRYDPRNGSLAVVADGFDKCNGLAFSLDEKTLYVTDSGLTHGDGKPQAPGRPHHVVAFDVDTEMGHLSGRRLFAVVAPGIPDGIKLDALGNVYTSSADGLRIFSPKGVLIGAILLPNGSANFTFGGKDGKTLLVCTDKAIVAVELAVTGALVC